AGSDPSRSDRINRRNALAAKHEFGKVLREGIVVVVLGGMVAYVANAVSPWGLSLSRNYFPGSNQPRPLGKPVPVQASATNASSPSPLEQLAGHFKEIGLQLVD